MDMLSRIKRPSLAVLAMILLLLQLPLQLFLLTPKAEATHDGSQHDSFSWRQANGVVIEASEADWTDRLEFLSPIEILDKATNTIYITTQDIFGKGSTTYLADGEMYWYIASDGKGGMVPWTGALGSECKGAFAWYLENGGEWSEIYAVQPERTRDGQACQMRDRGPVENLKGDIDDDKKYEIIAPENRGLTPSNVVERAVAPVYWGNKNVIKIFDSDKEFKLASGSDQEAIITAWSLTDTGNPSAEDRADTSKWEYWEHSDCENEFLVTRKRAPGATQADDDGYLIGPKHLSPTGEYRLITISEDDLECLTGRNIHGPSYDLIDYNANFVPISYPRNGVLEEGDPELETPEGGPGSSTGEIREDDSCESKSGVMGWVLCPVIELLDGAINWLDTQIQALLEIDENKYNNPGLKRAWTAIRNISYIILIPIMLVMVISTALGFEVFSAYTVKKALPRMVIAIIFITLSWYITAFLINFFNVVGSGILGLFTFPFREQMPSGPCQEGEFNLGCIFSVNTNGIDPTAILFGILSGAGAIIGLVLFLMFFGGTLLLASGAAFLVLLMRQMFIIALILVAPLAILAWIFPGNDKLWKTWWGAFSKLLIMFPLIMALIAVGRIFAFILNNGDAAGLEGAVLMPLMKLAAYILPYVFIPFTFKFAGGLFANLAGVVNDRNKGLFDRMKQNRAKKWERTESIGIGKARIPMGGRGILQARANMSRGLERYGSKAGFVGKHASRFAARRVGGHNIEAAMSAKNAQVAKEINEQIATGKDDDIRGLTVDMKAAKAAGPMTMQADGSMSNGLMRRKADGTMQYKSLGGAWVDEANVLAGQKRWGGDRFAQQAALSYEMRKAMTEEQVQGVAQRYSSLAQNQWGMSDSEASGAWIGAAFENQNQHLQFKGTDWKTGSLKNGGKDFVDELYEKKGTYQMSQMSSQTIADIKTAYDHARSTGDYDTQEKIAAIAENFMTEYNTGGLTGDPTKPEDLRPDPKTGLPTGRRQANSQGSAHVAERVVELAKHVQANPRQYGPGRSVYETSPGKVPGEEKYAPGHAPTDNERFLR